MGEFVENISKSHLRGEHLLIFVCVGSREYQFNRLLKKLDELVKQETIYSELFAQIGHSDYLPKYYSYERFISAELFKQYQQNADLIISHGGTGALIGALKLGKQVIAVPRLSKYGEHTDDHQTQICSVLAQEGYLKQVLDMDMLGEALMQSTQNPLMKKYAKPSLIVVMIEEYIILKQERRIKNE